MALKKNDKTLSRLCAALGQAGILERADKPDLQDGISRADKIIEAVRNIEVERVQGIGDDFIPNTRLYNALGTIYPYLTREKKDQAVRAYLNQFDKVNYFYTQLNHTSKIKEPLALADILAVRWAYFPGLDDEISKISKTPDYPHFESKFMTKEGLFKPNKVESDFLMAYACLRNDTWSFSQQYVKEAHPFFLQRVIQGLTSIYFAGAKTQEDETNMFSELSDILPREAHPSMHLYEAQKDWPKRELFP